MGKYRSQTVLPTEMSLARREGSLPHEHHPIDALRAAYRIMLRSRLCDEKIILLYKQNKCHFQIGAAGHEACQVAAASIFRAGIDWFYPYYRDMALCAGLGMTSKEFMLNALNRPTDPNSHGRQMPMHYGHLGLRMVSQSSPTGTQFLQAVGCALGAQKKSLREAIYVSSGEGTCSQGDFHEALNWASKDGLPIVFLIQNNDFAISVHVSEQLAGASVYKLALGYEGLNAFEVDGTNYFESHRALALAHQRALEGRGPSLIEAHVPRLQSHSISDNHLKYRSVEQIDQESTRDPLPRFREYLLDHHLATEQECTEWYAEIKQEVDHAAEWAEEQPECAKESATTHTIAENDPVFQYPEPTPSAGGNDIFLVDALNHALQEELEHNPNMYVFGQDVAYGKGGVFGVTAGLTTRFTDTRVFNAPLAESSIVGVAIGMATRGLKPVAEIQFGDYVWTAMMQIRNELALMSYRSCGDWRCPAVLRIPVGGYIQGGLYHSQNIEATFSHFPGLLVVYPSNAWDAKGLLKSAIRSTNPVLFLEHKGLYRQVYAKGVLPSHQDHLIPFGKARSVRNGDALTIITWGAMVQRSLMAAKVIAEQDGEEIEVIDLRTLVPLDIETIFASVQKTGRVLVAHEDVGFMGFGAEILAQISTNCFSSLDAPPERVTMKNVAAVPHAPPLEDVVLPQIEDIVEGARKVLGY